MSREYKRERNGQFASGGLILAGGGVAAASGAKRATGEARLGAREAELKAKWNIADTGQRVAGFNEQQFGIKSNRREHWQGHKDNLQASLDALPGERDKLRIKTNRGFKGAAALGVAGIGVGAVTGLRHHKPTTRGEEVYKADGVPPRPRKPREADKTHALTGIGAYAGVHGGFAAHNRFGASTTNAVHGLRIKESAGRAMRAQRKFQAYKSTETGVATPKSKVGGKYGNLSGLDDLTPRARKVVDTGIRAAKVGQGIRGTHNAVAAGTVAAGVVGGALLGSRGDKKVNSRNQADYQRRLGSYEQRKAKYDAAVTKAFPRPLPKIPKHGLTPNRLKPMTEFKPPGEGSTADQLKRAGDKIKRGKFMTQPRDPERHLGAW